MMTVTLLMKVYVQTYNCQHPVRIDEYVMKSSNRYKSTTSITSSIVIGWPEVRKCCPSNLHPYLYFRDISLIENQLLFRGHSVILSRLHEGHMDIEKMQ